jgi:uncharacterized membrane protein YkvA (DUF1232 family)
VIHKALALLPADPAENEASVRSSFLAKLARVAAHIPFASDAVALYFAALDPATPRRTKALMFAGLAYFILPFDLIPDVFVGIGYTNDAAVIAAVVALAGKSIKDVHREKAKDLLARMKAPRPAAAWRGPA